MLPSFLKVITGEDGAESGEVEPRELYKINKPGTVLRAAYREGDGGEVFGSHDANFMGVPFGNGGLFDGFGLQPR